MSRKARAPSLKNYVFYFEDAARRGAYAGEPRIYTPGFNVIRTSSGELMCATHVLCNDSAYAPPCKTSGITGDFDLVRVYDSHLMKCVLEDSNFDLDLADKRYVQLMSGEMTPEQL